VIRLKGILPIAVGPGLVVMAVPLLVSGCGTLCDFVCDRDDDSGTLAACISNQKQLALAMRQYSDDWDGVLPDVGTYSKGFYGTWDSEGAPHWMDAIGPYVRAGASVYRCPVVGDQPSPSYGWNRHLTGIPEAMIQFPTSCPLLWDWVPGVETSPGIPLDPVWGPDSWGYYPTNTGASNRDMARACSRHEEASSLGVPGGLVLGFVDGHAKFERPTRWTSQNTDGRFMACDDDAMPWPPAEYWGVVISMYPQDPMGG